MIIINKTSNMKESHIENEGDFVIEIPPKTPFYNAIKTEGDKVKFNGQTYSVFKKFWEDSTKKSLGSLHNQCANLECENEKLPSEYELQGAHIVFEKPKGPIQKGEACYIIPLCPKCNNSDNKKRMVTRYSISAPKIIWDNLSVFSQRK